jgi:glycine cleavage system aminomethyltransferase T
MVTGGNVLRLMKHLCSAQMDCSEGTSFYTLMLNDKGGIEGDMVVTRLGISSFYITTGSKDVNYFLKHIRKMVYKKRIDVDVKDVSDEYGIIS